MKRSDDAQAGHFPCPTFWHLSHRRIARGIPEYAVRKAKQVRSDQVNSFGGRSLPESRSQ
jgi:hypothetical protein